jgi:hypothetical protein
MTMEAQQACEVPGRGGTALENTALENTALENTALENTALENTALGNAVPRQRSAPMEGSSYLEGLAGALARRGLRTRLVTPHGRIPSLHVVNPLASALAEDIYAGKSKDGTWWFWWSWAERIGDAADVDAAAARIARVLAQRD